MAMHMQNLVPNLAVRASHADEPVRQTIHLQSIRAAAAAAARSRIGVNPLPPRRMGAATLASSPAPELTPAMVPPPPMAAPLLARRRGEGGAEPPLSRKRTPTAVASMRSQAKAMI